MEHYHETEETSKYENALALYPEILSDDQVKARTAKIIDKYVAENNTLEVKKQLFWKDSLSLARIRLLW